MRRMNGGPRRIQIVPLAFVLAVAIFFGQAHSQESMIVNIGGLDPVYHEHAVSPYVVIWSVPPDTEFSRIDMLIDCGEIGCWLDSVTPDRFFYDYEWEYFSYDLIYDSIVHIEIMPDVPEIPGEPLSFGGSLMDPFRLWFTIPYDSTTDCAVYPLKFYWFQCDDNRIESRSGDSIFVSDTVYNNAYWFPHEPLPPPTGIPSYSGTPDWCLPYISDEAEVLRHIGFYSGSLHMHCPDSVYFGERGDINLNGVCNEIADVVIFVNYFFHGLEAFDIDMDEQIMRTDINSDGVVLTFRDLVYQWLLIVGDILGDPVEPDTNAFPIAGFEQNTQDNTVEVNYPDSSLAGVFLIFEDSVTPTLSFSGPQVLWTYDWVGSETRIIVIADKDHEILSGHLLDLEGPGVLIDAQTTDYYTSEISTTVSVTYGEIGIGFVVGLVGYLFQNGPLPEPTELADADCSGYVDIDDIVWVLEYIFMFGPAPGDC